MTVTDLTRTMRRESSGPEEFSKWHPSELQEWAKSGYSRGRYNLARSGVPSVTNLTELPGGPFVPDLWGNNAWGHEGLKATLARMYSAKTENVLIAQGASQCNFLVAGSVLSGGGTAIVETPIYQPILRAVEVWADHVTRWPRRKQNRYQPDPDELAKLVTRDTRLVVLTNLHNPTHVALETERLERIVSLAEKAGAAVMIDEVFLPMLERDHSRHGHAFGAISIDSLDKAWGLDALRVGWAVGPEEIVHRAYRLNNLMGVNQPFITEDIAWRILDSQKTVSHLVERANRAAQGKVLFEDFLARTPEVNCVPPTAGISALIELPKGTDDQRFAETLRERSDTIVFPGSYFECPGSCRVSFGGPSAEVSEGLNQLRRQIQGRS